MGCRVDGSFIHIYTHTQICTRERQNRPYPEGVHAQDTADEEPDKRDPVELHLPPLPLPALKDVADGDALHGW